MSVDTPAPAQKPNLAKRIWRSNIGIPTRPAYLLAIVGVVQLGGVVDSMAAPGGTVHLNPAQNAEIARITGRPGDYTTLSYTPAHPTILDRLTWGLPQLLVLVGFLVVAALYATWLRAQVKGRPFGPNRNVGLGGWGAFAILGTLVLGSVSTYITGGSYGIDIALGGLWLAMIAYDMFSDLYMAGRDFQDELDEVV